MKVNLMGYKVTVMLCIGLKQHLTNIMFCFHILRSLTLAIAKGNIAVVTDICIILSVL